ncbi:helix-turn-helix domain-containing protein [Streptomyces sp. NPDC048295]|uniref:helix-turn-helix domain-containing protein n=1 Tax=Streptomyces sp. NPDC048295 TaxID=3154617 RepID=UPI00343CD11A
MRGDQEIGLVPDAANEPAQVSGRSRFALDLGFRAACGLALSDYQRDLRLRRARSLSAEGAAPSTAEAEAGYGDQAHLTRRFTRSYGITPAVYGTVLRQGVCPRVE